MGCSRLSTVDTISGTMPLLPLVVLCECEKKKLDVFVLTPFFEHRKIAMATTNLTRTVKLTTMGYYDDEDEDEDDGGKHET